MSEPLNLVLREIPTGFRIIDFGIPKEKMGNLVTRCCRPDDEPLAVLAIAQERTPFRDDGCNVVIATLRPVHAHVKLPVTRTTDRKSTRLNSSHSQISYAVFCLKKKRS